MKNLFTTIQLQQYDLDKILFYKNNLWKSWTVNMCSVFKVTEFIIVLLIIFSCFWLNAPADAGFKKTTQLVFPLVFKPGKSTVITLIRHPLSKLICLDSNGADQMVPWAQCFSIFMRCSLTLPPLKGWPLTRTLYDMNWIWNRAEGEASQKAHQPPFTVPRVCTRPLREKALHMWEQSEPMLGQTWHEFPCSDGALSLEGNICANHTESEGWMEFGVQRQSQGIRLRMSDHVTSVQEHGNELWPLGRLWKLCESV